MSHTFDDYIDENGHITIAEGLTLVRHVEVNVAENADTLAYRFIDYSRERDGEAHELTWSQFGTRLRAVAARLQQVTKPGDRVAILAPQGLDYVVAFFGAIYAGTIAVPLFDPDEPSWATAAQRPSSPQRTLQPACATSSARCPRPSVPVSSQSTPSPTASARRGSSRRLSSMTSQK